MKYIFGIVLFAAGGSLGYWVAVQQLSDPQVIKTPIITQAEPATVEVVDSTIVKELNDAEKDNDRLEEKVDLLADSLETLSEAMDSLTAKQDTSIMALDSIVPLIDSFVKQEELILIDREILLSSAKMLIEKQEQEIEVHPSAVDSLKEALNVKTKAVTEITVEQWKSPLDFKGYRLSKTKLVLYGLYNELLIGIKQKQEQLYLQTNVATYALEFTNELRSFKKLLLEEE